MSNTSIISQIFEFLGELFNSLDRGTLFFGSLWDFIRYTIDIALVTFLFYTILMFIRQTRAWQLIKGIVFVLVFVAFCGLIGLDMVGFLFNRLLYIVAILFVVLFQPELRRALETVGLRTSSATNPFRHSEAKMTREELNSFIKEISSACKEMSRTYTGALILIERNTKLDELFSQENVVAFDSEVTSSVLQSIFYKGSPMHDGGLLIRDGRIVAARCHVPLSVTMHSLERFGTRHRAAVGASEMGDTVAVVVSEERGKTSIAVNGRLFEMRSTKELEANLSYLLGVKEFGGENKNFIEKIFDKLRGKPAEQTDSVLSKEEVDAGVKAKATSATAEPIVATTQVEVAGETAVPISIRTKVAAETSNSQRVSTTTRILFIVLSFFLSLGLWMYIQIITNPVVTRNITVPISKYKDDEVPDNVEVGYPLDYVDIEIVGRAGTINNLTADDIVATINYDNIDTTDVGIVNLPVEVSARDRNVYFRVERQQPSSMPVTIYAVN
ncbi:MAG: diadenylate cyclase CdaA [Saccharofermentans sp.]|nr:diadenylate cyclase CdaA [Saccharofermentans sp.]